MNKKENEVFYKNQNQILENLETLRENIENCEEMGMIDLQEINYNEILELIDDTKSADTIFDFSEIINRAKAIEIRIDSWYSKQGITNIELIWPQE